jgi:hypothetical protein
MRHCQGAQHTAIAGHAPPSGYDQSNGRFPVPLGRAVEQLLTWLTPRHSLAYWSRF